jgi:hypothetical protein
MLSLGEEASVHIINSNINAFIRCTLITMALLEIVSPFAWTLEAKNQWGIEWSGFELRIWRMNDCLFFIFVDDLIEKLHNDNYV